MAILTNDAAVQGGHGCCGFLPLMKNTTTGDTELATIGGNYLDFYTGRNYPNKVIQITSGFSVSAEGAVTGTLETTNRGPKTATFLERYLPMYKGSGASASVAGMETLTDETGWNDDTGGAAVVNVPVDDQLVAIQFGEPFLGSASGTPSTWYIPIDVAVVSLGNETASNTLAANTYGRRNWTLNGQPPANDIEISLAKLQAFTTANDIGIDIVAIQGSATSITLRKGVSKEEFILEVQGK